MVLRVDWLKELNPFTFDFTNLTLHFNYHGESILLQGVTNGALLRVVVVEFLEDFSNLEDEWMA